MRNLILFMAFAVGCGAYALETAPEHEEEPSATAPISSVKTELAKADAAAVAAVTSHLPGRIVLKVDLKTGRTVAVATIKEPLKPGQKAGEADVTKLTFSQLAFDAEKNLNSANVANPDAPESAAMPAATAYVYGGRGGFVAQGPRGGTVAGGYRYGAVGRGGYWGGRGYWGGGHGAARYYGGGGYYGGGYYGSNSPYYGYTGGYYANGGYSPNYYGSYYGSGYSMTYSPYYPNYYANVGSGCGYGYSVTNCPSTYFAPATVYYGGSYYAYPVQAAYVSDGYGYLDCGYGGYPWLY